jgi:hypothetical protein
LSEVSKFGGGRFIIPFSPFVYMSLGIVLVLLAFGLDLSSFNIVIGGGLLVNYFTFGFQFLKDSKATSKALEGNKHGIKVEEPIIRLRRTKSFSLYGAVFFFIQTVFQGLDQKYPTLLGNFGDWAELCLELVAILALAVAMFNASRLYQLMVDWLPTASSSSSSN